MGRFRHTWKSFVITALASALVSLLVVAVGPGFSEPNKPDEDAAVTEEAAVVAAATPTPTQSPHSAAGNSTASTTPDTHGHVGAGTGTSTGSQADPGHGSDTEPADGGSNGPGTGDVPAIGCPNDQKDPGPRTDPYDSTCDGKISQNGQGGDAPGGGTPCAGCVGNADDKNPPGQLAEFNGQKPNDMGYECDGNQGVGSHYKNGNPAHTGNCSAPPVTPTRSVSAFCFSVTASASENITLVVVTFVDNTTQSFTNVGTSFTSPTFTKAVRSVAATSGGQTVTANAPTNCVVQSPTLVVNVNCDNLVTATSTVLNIDSVTVRFTDGTSQTFSNIGGLSFSQSFTKPVSSATAVSGSNIQTANAPTNCGDTPTLSVDAQCFSVSVTSNRPIQSVVVTLANGTVDTITNPTSPFTKGYATPVASVVATATGLAPVSDTAPTNCGTQPPPPQIAADCFSVTATSSLPITSVTVTFADGTSQTFTNIGGLSFTQDFTEQVASASVTSGGTTATDLAPTNCAETPPLCPPGTDLAGEIMPGGDIRNCDDEVLGEIIDNEPPPDEVEPGRFDNPDRPETKPGRVLPFTGASIFAYLLLALELMGAGALLLRARSRRR